MTHTSITHPAELYTYPAITKQQLAHMLGISRRTMTRYIRCLIRAGLITDLTPRQKRLLPHQTAIFCHHYGLSILDFEKFRPM